MYKRIYVLTYVNDNEQLAIWGTYTDHEDANLLLKKVKAVYGDKTKLTSYISEETCSNNEQDVV
jgi:hypothetical protein